MHFRKATAADKDAILALYRSLVGTKFCAWTLDYPGEEDIEKDLSADALFCLENEKGQIVGTISIDQDEEVESLPCWSKELQPAGELSRLGVVEAYQNQGLARQLLLYGMDELRRQGYKSVHFLVCKSNKKAIRSYDKLSFAIVGECSLFGEEWWCYEKRLQEEGYSYRNFFKNLYQSLGQTYTFQAKTVEEAVKWQETFRNALRKTLGLKLLEDLAGEWRSGQKAGSAVAGAGTLLECVREEGYTRYKFRLETLPEVAMPFYMLVPEGVTAQNPARAVIAIPAHGANKDTVAGVPANDAVREKLFKSPKEAYGLAFVKRGYVAFCPDPPGYGERLEPEATEDRAFRGAAAIDSDEGEKPSMVSGPIREDTAQDPLGCSCKNLAQTAEALGLSLTALEIWDLMRLVEFAISRPEVDAKRIVSAGFSGGGQYAMWLAAMDERIAAAAVSGYVHGYYDSILDVHLCPCNYAPMLWRLGDISDICSLIAPRPLFVENGRKDPLNGYRGIQGPREQVARIGEAYRLYGKEECLRHVTPEGSHQWYGECYEFLDQALHEAAL